MISPYLARLRQLVGHDLLLLPSACVLPFDGGGRLLLVRQADSGLWATIGGTIEVDETPASAAVREALEEAGVQVELVRIIACLGGPGYRLRYSNGDEAAYVSVVYEARIAGGSPRPDNEEVVEVGWFKPAELSHLALNDFTRHLLADAGILTTQGRHSSRPLDYS